MRDRGGSVGPTVRTVPAERALADRRHRPRRQLLRQPRARNPVQPRRQHRAPNPVQPRRLRRDRNQAAAARSSDGVHRVTRLPHRRRGLRPRRRRRRRVRAGVRFSVGVCPARSARSRPATRLAANPRRCPASSGRLASASRLQSCHRLSRRHSSRLAPRQLPARSCVSRHPTAGNALRSRVRDIRMQTISGRRLASQWRALRVRSPSGPGAMTGQSSMAAVRGRGCTTTTITTTRAPAIRTATARMGLDSSITTRTPGTTTTTTTRTTRRTRIRATRGGVYQYPVQLPDG